MSGLRIVLAADEAIGPRVANLILRSAHELVAVATPSTHQEDHSGLAALAIARDVPCLDARKLNGADLVSDLTSVGPDVLLNVHSLTKVSPEVLDMFPTGAWNLHPGALPEAAGANVPSWAIALRWDNHGVTLHKMTSDYDDGDIAFEDRFSIDASTTGLKLSVECSRRGLALIQSLIAQLEQDPAAVPAMVQDTSQRRYFGRKQPAEGRIDWTWSAADVEAYVRACDFRPFPSPWDPPRALVGDCWYELLSVEVGQSTSEQAGTVLAGETCAVAAADRWVRLTEARPVPATKHPAAKNPAAGNREQAEQ